MAEGELLALKFRQAFTAWALALCGLDGKLWQLETPFVAGYMLNRLVCRYSEVLAGLAQSKRWSANCSPSCHSLLALVREKQEDGRGITAAALVLYPLSRPMCICSLLIMKAVRASAAKLDMLKCNNTSAHTPPDPVATHSPYFRHPMSINTAKAPCADKMRTATPIKRGQRASQKA